MPIYLLSLMAILLGFFAIAGLLINLVGARKPRPNVRKG